MNKLGSVQTAKQLRKWKWTGHNLKKESSVLNTPSPRTGKRGRRKRSFRRTIEEENKRV
jgi:hypothetical protein